MSKNTDCAILIIYLLIIFSFILYAQYWIKEKCFYINCVQIKTQYVIM